MNDYRQILVSGSASYKYPMEVFFAVLWQKDKNALTVPVVHPYRGEWGEPMSIQLSDQYKTEIPNKIDMVWLSILERKFYSLESKLSYEKINCLFNKQNDNSNVFLFDSIVIGMAPYGEIAIWFYGLWKSCVVEWLKGEPIEVLMRDYLPGNPTISLESYCASYSCNEDKPTKDLFDRYMQQFTYRYQVIFGHWDGDDKEWNAYEEGEIKPDLDYIEEALYDGTHDKLHDGGLLKFHQAGKPKKLALQWHIKKSDYSAYLWFDDMKIRDAFEQFYTKYPEAKMNFIFHIDTENKVFQLSFDFEEVDEPMHLSEDAYQMIIFKSKFEYYRTPNYDQPHGAWVW